jgi:hypothetical protein
MEGLTMGGYIHRVTVGIVALAAAMALAGAGAGAAQAAWSGAAPLSNGRYDHTATALKDGRVLVTGGYDGGALGTARLYDPATNQWSDAAPMHFARHGHAAVLLHSGKVLVAGGYAPSADPASPASGYTRTAEIYDPAANTWTQAANMSKGRFQPTMTVLPDGRVLVAGGAGDIVTADGVRAAVPLDSAEIYDPQTDSWSDAPPMAAARTLHTATLLPDGDVLVAGGGGDGSGDLRSAELYDPAANSWSPTGPLAEAHDAATATALPGGDVLLAGGDGADGHALASAEVYRPESGTWHTVASMPAARESAAAAPLDDGTVLVAGGEDARLGETLAGTERYDPASDTWTDAGAMADARKQLTLTALDNGRALVVGGNPGGFDRGLAGAERFSPVSTSLTDSAFGTQPVGTPSAVVDAVLTNTGSKPVAVTGVSVGGADAGDFAVVSESCSAAAVQPGQTCTVGLRFTPAAAGARSATLNVADNTAAGATTAALSGTGVAPAADPGAAAPGGGAPADPAGPASGATGGGGLATGPSGATGGGSLPADPSAGTGAAGGLARTAPSGASGATAGGAVAGARSQRPARRRVARATCRARTTRHGRGRSTVTCRVTWPTRQRVALLGRLVHRRSVLATARATARAGHATLRLRPAGRLHKGRYRVVITRRDGTPVVRRAIRVT